MNKRLITTAVAVAAATTQIFATEGINLIGIGPVQQGTAGAGVASAKDSTWLILNPAGLVDLQPSADASLQVFGPYRTLDSGPWGGMAGKQTDESAFVIPSISGSFGCCHGENGFIGLGVYGTSGMGVDYNYGRVGQQTGPTTIVPQDVGDKMTELSIAKATATYAYKAGDSGFSVGAGPIFVISRLRTDMLNPGTGAYESGDWDMAYGVGAIIGVNQKLGMASIGGSYMTEQYMGEFDEYKNLMPDSLNLPQQLTLGAALNPADNVEIAIDYRWVGWGQLKTLGDQFGWEDQNIIKAGITWGVNDALTLRTGISYGNSPIPDDKVFANALFPAIMETHAALGASYAWEKWAVHLAYVHAFEADQTESTGLDMTAAGGPPNFGQGTKISMYQNSLTAGVTYTF